MKKLVIVVLLLISVIVSAQIVGWRNDGTGVFPGAQIPTKWSTSENVLWKAAMPDWSNASPIIVKDKIFICGERTKLRCLSLKDGKILWEKDNPYLGVIPPSEVAKAKDGMAKGEAIKKRLQQAEKPWNTKRRELRKDPKNAALKAEIEELKKKADAIRKELAPYQQYMLPSCHPVTGYSSPTPFSDGKHVYVLFGTGVAACFDLDGNRKWARLVGRPKHGWGHSASPLLLGNKLIVHVDKIMALDTATGKTLWETPARPGWGSPVQAKIGNLDVLVSHSGDLVNLADGKKLIKRPFRALQFNAPIIDGDKVYYIQDQSIAYKLSQEGEAIKADQLWQARIKKDRYYASPVLVKDLIYGITRMNELTVLNAADGSVVYTQKLDLGKGTVYPSIFAAGDHIYLSHDNGTTIVIKAGNSYQEVAKNMLEPFRTSPLVHNNKIYIRANKNMYCIGK